MHFILIYPSRALYVPTPPFIPSTYPNHLHFIFIPIFYHSSHPWHPRLVASSTPISATFNSISSSILWPSTSSIITMHITTLQYPTSSFSSSPPFLSLHHIICLNPPNTPLSLPSSPAPCKGHFKPFSKPSIYIIFPSYPSPE